MKHRDKYFQDYTTYRVPKGNGKGQRTIRVYDGDVYVLDASDGRRIRKKLLCAGLILAFFILGLIAGFQNVAANKGYASIPYVVALLAGVYCGLGVINLTVSGKDMTEFEYREYSKQIVYGSAMSICTMGIAALTYLIFMIMSLAGGGPENQSGSSLTALLCGCACCACAYGIYRIEKKSKYIIVPGKLSGEPDADCDDDDAHIKYESNFYRRNAAKWRSFNEHHSNVGSTTQ